MRRPRLRAPGHPRGHGHLQVRRSYSSAWWWLVLAVPLLLQVVLLLALHHRGTTCPIVTGR